MASTPDLVVWVGALAKVTVHFLIVPPSFWVYKWVPAKYNAGGNSVIDYHPIQGVVEIPLVA